MKYLKGCWGAIADNWGGVLVRDAACGNAFQILLYGFKSSLMIVLFYVFRVLFALAFPLSAIIIIQQDKKQKEWEKRVKADLDLDL